MRGGAVLDPRGWNAREDRHVLLGLRDAHRPREGGRRRGPTTLGLDRGPARVRGNQGRIGARGHHGHAVHGRDRPWLCPGTIIANGVSFHWHPICISSPTTPLTFFSIPSPGP